MIELPQGVQYCVLSPAKIRELWLKLRGFDRLFTDDIRWDEFWFFERMYDNPDTIVLETEGGILTLTGIEHKPHQPPPLYAHVHVSFWDCKLSVREDLLKECLIWAFLKYDLYRLEALIPEFSRALRRFMEKKLGFSFEGRLRNRMLYKGQLTDVLMYSILREEVELNGR